MTLTLEQIHHDVAASLGEDPAEIPTDENLVDYGLDSVRIMALLERWRRDHDLSGAAGASGSVDFADLAEAPAIEAWAKLLGATS